MIHPFIYIELACGTAHKQILLTVQLNPGANVQNAIDQSGILDHFPEFDRDSLAVGIEGQLVDPETPLISGQRVEIYQPRRADAKQLRHQRIKRTLRERRS